MRRFASVLALLGLLTLTACKPQKKSSDKTERIQALQDASTKEAFMSLFLKFISDNKLATDLVNYEDELVQQKYLDGYDDKALHNYFEKIIGDETDGRCISKALADRLMPPISKFAYQDYKTSTEQQDGRGTAEYIFLEYLKNEGIMWREALEEALKNNELSIEKRYFYLMMTMPAKTCS